MSVSARATVVTPHGVRLESEGEAGFTLVETMVALFLFLLLASSAASLLVAALRTSRSNDARIAATQVAAAEQERIRGLPIDPNGNYTTKTATNVSVGGRRYTITNSISFQTAGGTANACAGATGPAAFLRINTTVTWPNMGAVKPIRSDSIKSVPIAGTGGTTGTITVPVTDRNGAPVAGVPVTLNPGSLTATTGPDGCAVFSALAPGTGYVASISKTGYVDPVGNPAPVTSAMSSAAGVVTKSGGFVFDLAVTANITLSAPSGYPFLAAPDAYGVTLGNASFTGGSKNLGPCQSSGLCYSVTGSSSVTPTRRVIGLFPSTAGYTVWTGSCTDATPTALGSASVPTQPGGSFSVSAVAAGGVQLTASSAGKSYLAVHAATASCVNGASGRESFVLPTSDASGQVKAALPAGRWRIVSSLSNADTSSKYVEIVVTAGATSSATIPGSV